jgi:Mn2+/Fe2+ NRAMP family transporter
LKADFATVLSFVIAPIIAVFNFRLVTGKHLDEDHHPSLGLKILSVSGIIFLIGFATIFAMLKLNLFSL